MSRTYHSRKSYQQKMDEIRRSREKHASETGVTVLSTLNQHWNGRQKAMATLTRHPSGTRATGLRRGLQGQGLVKAYRDRFGLAEEQSSRLKRRRMAGKHALRLKSKKELRSLMYGMERFKEA